MERRGNVFRRLKNYFRFTCITVRIKLTSVQKKTCNYRNWHAKPEYYMQTANVYLHHVFKKFRQFLWIVDKNVYKFISICSSNLWNCTFNTNMCIERKLTLSTRIPFIGNQFNNICKFSIRQINFSNWLLYMELIRKKMNRQNEGLLRDSSTGRVKQQ